MTMPGPKPVRTELFQNWVSQSGMRLYLLFVLLPLLPIVLFTYATDVILEKRIEDQSLTESKQLANLSALLVEEHFRQNANLLQSMADEPDFREAWMHRNENKYRDMIYLHMQLSHAIQPDSALVSAYETDGTMRSIAPVDPAVMNSNFAYRDWYKGVVEHWRPYISEVYRTKAAPQQLAIAVAVPIKDKNGVPIGIIAAAYSLERVTGWLREVNEYGTRNITVVDQKGHQLAGPGINVYSDPVDMNDFEPVRLAIKGNAGQGKFDHKGENTYAAYSSIHSLGWGVVVDQSEDHVLQRMNDVRRQTYTVAFIFAAMALACGGIIASLYRGQKKLNEQVAALTGSEARYRSLIQGATYGIYRANEKGFTSVNPAMVAMLGYDSEEEVLALNLERDLYVDADSRKMLIEKYKNLSVLESEEVRWKRKDGKIITVQVSGRTLHDESGKLAYFEMIAEDVTRKRELEDQLRQSQKIEAVGRLAGGVAHDFNNLLTVISGYNEMVLENLGAGHPMRAELQEVRKATERATALTSQLLAFSRQQVLETKVVDLNTVLISMENLLSRLLGENIEVSILTGHSLGSVRADPGQLGQVIMNLAINARDAMPKGGKLTLETANMYLDRNYIKDHPGCDAGAYVMLAVSDTGIGMDADTRAHIFDPFFTTKPQGSGTGLGLATVYGIVKQSGGNIWVYSELGLGTTFKLYFPRVDAPPEKTEQQRKAEKHALGSETVLLVEDEEGVRALTSAVLRKAGYKVLEAVNPETALKFCHEHTGLIDLLLTDVVLQQSSGRELSLQVKALRPNIKILFMSGYTDDVVLHRGVVSAESDFLQKPFTTSDLAKKVRDIIDRP